MKDYISGYANWDTIEHCPYCSSDDLTFSNNSKIECETCKKKWYVIEADEED